MYVISIGSKDERMVGSPRDKVTQLHRGDEGRSLGGRTAARSLGRSDLRAGPGVVNRAAGRSRLARAGWLGGKLLVAALVVAVLAALLGAVDSYLRTPSAGGAAHGTIPVVWRQPGQDTVRISSVDRERWQEFLTSRHGEQARVRKAILDEARAGMTAALVPVFDGMKGRIGDYSRWFYSFFTNYRMAMVGVIAVRNREDGDERSSERIVTDALNRMLQEKFLEAVVVPERYGPDVDALSRQNLQRAIAREQAAAEQENQALAVFMAEQGRPFSRGAGAERDDGMVLAWEALGIPVTAASMASPPDPVGLIKGDPAFDALQTTTATEGMMLATRQMIRQSVRTLVSGFAHGSVVPLVAGALGPAEVLLVPVVGIGAFAVGFGAEYGAVLTRQAVEAQRQTDLSLSVIDHLRTSQTRALSDALAQRIESWLGG